MLDRTLRLLLLLILSMSFAQTTDYKTKTDIPYYENTVGNVYQKERCKLDLYYPDVSENFSTIVWFHGGGLKSGFKEIPSQLKNKGHAVVAVNYRLHPQVSAPKYVEDAAAAVAWVFKNIDQFGGDPSKIYVCGFSSGGFLSLMLSLIHI